MLTVLYEDKEIIVVEKPAGIESQSARGIEPDMVSCLQRYLQRQKNRKKEKLSTKEERLSTISAPYIGVIHRLDKPVSGVMVYAKTPKAASILSNQIISRKINKFYLAVVCGKLVDKSGKFVDYLWKDEKKNCSFLVDKSENRGKRAELSYEVLKTIKREQELSLVNVHLLTGRHHQIRVQFCGHGFPLWGDNRYNPDFSSGKKKGSIALCASGLSFYHPENGKEMSFSVKPKGGAFDWFFAEDNKEEV